MKFRVHNHEENLLKYENYLIDTMGILFKANSIRGKERYEGVMFLEYCSPRKYKIQYITKFKDINNKPIYEGDIVEDKSFLDNPGLFILSPRGLRHTMEGDNIIVASLDNLEDVPYEIIGNVVENPEMLDMMVKPL